MVSNANEDLPDPDKPVKTISRSRGSSRVMFLRLCSRAPWMTRESVPTGPECNGGPRHARSGACRGPLGDAGLSELAELLAQLVHLVSQARGVLEPEIPCGLVHLLLESLDQPLELLGRDALGR